MSEIDEGLIVYELPKREVVGGDRSISSVSLLPKPGRRPGRRSRLVP